VIIPNRYSATGGSAGGGMGDIIQCTDTHLNRPVVIKVLKDGQEERRLIDEQKALMKVRSKHVVQLYDIITVTTNSEDKPALVLEYIEGSDLVPSSFTTNNLYLKTIWQVACGLAEIHKENVIHRDIKPNNIRLDADNVIKILDFGLSRSAGIDAKTVGAIGTPMFMAPELWQREEAHFDAAVDVYAYGITALILINENIPNELLRYPPAALTHGELNTLLMGAPDDVITIIEKCLSHTPSDRPSMAEVESTIKRHLLFGRHRAHLVLGQNTHLIDASSPKATVSAGANGSIGIDYDGTCFKVAAFTGLISINNVAVSIGTELPACCVIAFVLANNKKYVTFDVSYPEVTA
jgi:serine/threonine protein kinase